MKTCSKCKTDKPKSEFYKDRCQPDGLDGTCKTCRKKRNRSQSQKEANQRYNKTPKGIVNRMWARMRHRVGHSFWYDNVEIQVSPKEFKEWALPRVTKFLKENPGITPSVDRVDPKGHYAISNLRIISDQANLGRSNILLYRLRKKSKEQQLRGVADITNAMLDELGLSKEDLIGELGGTSKHD